MSERFPKWRTFKQAFWTAVLTPAFLLAGFGLYALLVGQKTIEVRGAIAAIALSVSVFSSAWLVCWLQWMEQRVEAKGRKPRHD